MNKKELAEIRKNFNENSGFFTLDRVLTAYVDPEKNVLFRENKNFALIPEDEGAVMFETLRKVLGGGLGKNLVEYAFPDRACGDVYAKNGTEELGAYVHLSLTTKGKLKDKYANDDLIKKIVDNYECSGAYAIIIGYCTYSIMSRNKNDEEYDGNVDEYNFIVTALCPACTGDDGLMFDRNNASIIKKSNTDLLISRTPTDGFLYPVFSDRAPDVNNVMYYTKTPKKPNISMIEDVLDCDFVMTCQNEKAAFGKILSEVLGDDLSYTVITQIDEALRDIAVKFRDRTEIPTLTPSILNGILDNIGFGGIDTFPIFKEITGGVVELRVENLIENKVVLKTPGVTVSVDCTAADKVRTSVRGISVLDGRKRIIIDLDDPNVTVNDINIRF